MAKSNTSGYDIEKDPFAPNKIFENGGKPLPEGENGQMILNENGEWVAIDPPFVKEEDIEGLETLINEIKEKTDELETSISQIETDVSGVKGQITTINADITQLRSWVNDIDDIVQTIQQVDIAILYEEIETINTSTIPELRTEFNQSISTLTTNLNSVIEDITEINSEITNIKTVDIVNLNTKYDGLATRLVTVEEELETLINETIPAIEHTIQIITETGTVGQVLTKTEDGIAWADSHGGGGGLPEGGTPGQVLTKTETGAEWANPKGGIRVIKSSVLNGMSDEEIRNAGVIYVPDKKAIFDGETVDLDLLYSYEGNVQTFHYNEVFSSGTNILVDDVIENFDCDYACIYKGAHYFDDGTGQRVKETGYALTIVRDSTEISFKKVSGATIWYPITDGTVIVYAAKTLEEISDMVKGYAPLIPYERGSQNYNNDIYDGFVPRDNVNPDDNLLLLSHTLILRFHTSAPYDGEVLKRQVIGNTPVIYDPNTRVAEGFDLISGDSVTIEDNAIRTNKIAYIKNKYTELTNDAKLTVYFITKQVNEEQDIETFLCVPYSASSGNAPNMFYNNGTIWTSIYGNDNNSNYNSRQYNVLAMRFTDDKKVSFFVNGNLVRTETYKNIRDTVYFGYAGLSTGSRCDVLMRFGAVVKEIEDDNTVIANQLRLMQRYGVV